MLVCAFTQLLYGRVVTRLPIADFFYFVLQTSWYQFNYLHSRQRISWPPQPERSVSLRLSSFHFSKSVRVRDIEDPRKKGKPNKGVSFPPNYNLALRLKWFFFLFSFSHQCSSIGSLDIEPFSLKIARLVKTPWHKLSVRVVPPGYGLLRKRPLFHQFGKPNLPWMNKQKKPSLKI